MNEPPRRTNRTGVGSVVTVVSTGASQINSACSRANTSDGVHLGTSSVSGSSGLTSQIGDFSGGLGEGFDDGSMRNEEGGLGVTPSSGGLSVTSSSGGSDDGTSLEGGTLLSGGTSLSGGLGVTSSSGGLGVTSLSGHGGLGGGPLLSGGLGVTSLSGGLGVTPWSGGLGGGTSMGGGTLLSGGTSLSGGLRVTSSNGGLGVTSLSSHGGLGGGPLLSGGSGVTSLSGGLGVTPWSGGLGGGTSLGGGTLLSGGTCSSVSLGGGSLLSSGLGGGTLLSGGLGGESLLSGGLGGGSLLSGGLGGGSLLSGGLGVTPLSGHGGLGGGSLLSGGTSLSGGLGVTPSSGALVSQTVGLNKGLHDERKLGPPPPSFAQDRLTLDPIFLTPSVHENYLAALSMDVKKVSSLYQKKFELPSFVELGTEIECLFTQCEDSSVHRSQIAFPSSMSVLKNSLEQLNIREDAQSNAKMDTSLPPLLLKPGSTVVVEDWNFRPTWGVGSIKNTESDEGSSNVGPKRGVFCKAFCCKPRPPSNTDDVPKPFKDHMALQSATYKGKGHLFISNVEDRHKCAICLSLACSAVQSSCCGCTFCSGCIQEWKSQHTPSTCPQCRQAITEVPDRRNEMEILNLELVCPNHKSGCEWRGALSKIDNHLEEACDYVEVECAKQCGKKTLKKNANEHNEYWCPLRHVMCPFCSLKFNIKTSVGIKSKALTYKALTTEHHKVCSKWPMLCPNRCNEMYDLNRSSLLSHICPNKLVPCEFAKFGCSQQMRPSEMAEHIRSGTMEHLLMMKKRFQAEIDHLKRQNKELAQTVALLSQIFSQKLGQMP